MLLEFLCCSLSQAIRAIREIRGSIPSVPLPSTTSFRTRLCGWDLSDFSVLLKQVQHLLVHDLIKDLNQSVALLQVLEELRRRYLVSRRQLCHALSNLFLRHLDVLLFSNLLQKKGNFDAFFGTLGGGRINLLLLLFDRVARDAAFGILLHNVINNIAGFMRDGRFVRHQPRSAIDVGAYVTEYRELVETDA